MPPKKPTVGNIQKSAESGAPNTMQSIKREAEDPLESLLTKPEEPWARRSKIFDALATLPSPKVDQEKIRSISSADYLTDYELKECYDIARAAMAAQFDHRKVTATVMEDFLKAVFDDWNALKAPPVLQELQHFPLESQTICPSKIYIGTLMLDREPVSIQHMISLVASADEVSLKIEVVYPEKPKSRKRQNVNTNDIRRVAWYSDSAIIKSRDSVRQTALIQFVGQIATYNRERAVKYARNMLHHQTLGTATPAPCSGRYEFAKLSTIFRSLPLLELSDLEKGERTVVMFSKAELPAEFDGSEAIRGSERIKVAAGQKAASTAGS